MDNRDLNEFKELYDHMQRGFYSRYKKENNLSMDRVKYLICNGYIHDEKFLKPSYINHNNINRMYDNLVIKKYVTKVLNKFLDEYFINNDKEEFKNEITKCLNEGTSIKAVFDKRKLNYQNDTVKKKLVKYSTGFESTREYNQHMVNKRIENNLFGLMKVHSRKEVLKKLRVNIDTLESYIFDKYEATYSELRKTLK